MGTRLRNRPVSTAVANRPRTLETGLPGAHSARPCARDPPSSVPRVSYQSNQQAANVPWHTRHGKTPGHSRPKGKRRCSNIASPQRRTREASPSYS